jgi:hypothetical protein
VGIDGFSLVNQPAKQIYVKALDPAQFGHSILGERLP